MEEHTINLIKELTEAQGISGDEGRVRELMRTHLEPLVDRIEVSPLGNIFGVVECKNPDAPRVMVAAHMDEVGFMVSQIHDNGTLSVKAIGGWNPYAVSAQRYTLMTKDGDYPVISSAVAPHLLRGEKAQSLKAEDIRFDAGFTSKEEAQEYGVRPGDSIVPDVETIMTANKKSMISKAWDNRYGCVAVIEMLKAIQGIALDVELIAGASVQEEVGLRGIKGAIHQYQPDIFIAVDCSPAADTEAGKDEHVEGRLDEGFLLRTQDPGMITHKGLWEYIHDLAEEHNITYQYFFSKGGTDAGAAHTMNDGVPSAVIGVPGRYIHGHQTLFTLADYASAREILTTLITTIDQEAIDTINNK